MNNTQENLIKLMHMINSWSVTPPGQDSDESLQEILCTLTYCEDASKKSHDELKILRRETIRDQQMYRKIARKISSLKKQICSKKKEYLKAKMYRKEQMKVDLLSDLIREYPPCSTLKETLQGLQQEVEHLEVKHKLLTTKFSSIEKQVKIMENLSFFTHELILEPECD